MRDEMRGKGWARLGWLGRRGTGGARWAEAGGAEAGIGIATCIGDASAVKRFSSAGAWPCRSRLSHELRASRSSAVVVAAVTCAYALTAASAMAAHPAASPMARRQSCPRSAEGTPSHQSISVRFEQRSVSQCGRISCRHTCDQRRGWV